MPFRVEMTNRLPVPLSIKTSSPILWTWSIDGYDDASHVSLYDPPAGESRFRFDRGERKQFDKSWSGMFRISESEWRPATPGEYTLRVAINVYDGRDDGLTDEAIVRIEDGNAS